MRKNKSLWYVNQDHSLPPTFQHSKAKTPLTGEAKITGLLPLEGLLSERSRMSGLMGHLAACP